jgi:hypothetical protein
MHRAHHELLAAAKHNNGIRISTTAQNISFGELYLSLKTHQTRSTPVVVPRCAGFLADHLCVFQLMRRLAHDLTQPPVLQRGISVPTVGNKMEGGPMPCPVSPSPVFDTHTRATARMDIQRVVTVGHSAGSQLAFRGWSAQHRIHNGRLRAYEPAPTIRTVSLAGCVDLECGATQSWRERRHRPAWLATSKPFPNLYAVASPCCHSGTTKCLFMVHAMTAFRLM